MDRAAAIPSYVACAVTPFLLADIASATEDKELPLSASVTIATEYVFRGISQTLGNPALQASLDLQFDNGFYAYAWGSNVDFYPASEPDDGARLEINIAAGYATQLNDRWSIDVSLVHYLFPSTHGEIDYDYSELISTLCFDDRLSATLGYSNSVDGTDTESWFSELGYEFALPRDVAFGVAYGYYDLSNAYGSGYGYARADWTRDFAATQLSLSYYEPFGGADQIYFEQASDSRFVVSILLNF
ncbi:MAG: TorF family putative porin [Woeseiaceae bacterium]